MTAFALGAVSWVGHAALVTALLNNLYGRKLPKAFLRPYRLASGAAIAAHPPAFALAAIYQVTPWPLLGYVALTLVMGAVLPAVTLARRLRRPPAALVATHSTVTDYWQTLGEAAVGEGKYAALTRLPGTCAFEVEDTHLTLAPPGLPPAWSGLTLRVLSDLHFHGVPSRAFFRAALAPLLAEEPPDLLLLAGDFIDSDAHLPWVGELLADLPAKLGRYAVLGNHDQHHQPDAVRAALRAAGYTVLSGAAVTLEHRGHPLTLVGHEGPWFPGPPEFTAPGFTLVLSHSPDAIAWAAPRGADLVVAGHVHGGQIRVPLIGSIFVPSVFGRRYDCGVFQRGRTLMAVGRGLSGKEPLRVRCRPQVLKLTLVAPG